jgi:hypothetical protein
MTGRDAAPLERRDARTGTARMRRDSDFMSEPDFASAAIGKRGGLQRLEDVRERCGVGLAAD